MTNAVRFFALSALIFLSIGLFAQNKFIAGGRIGLGLSQLPELNESGSITHFAFGGSFNYSFVSWAGISADALFLTTGGTYKGSTMITDPQGFVNEEHYDGDIRFTTLSIPVYPQLSFGNDDFRILLNGGIATNFNLFASESRDYENDENNENVDDLVKDILEDYTIVSFAPVYGVGTKFKLDEEEFLQVDIRASMGLNDLYTTKNNEMPTTFKRNLYTLSVTYFF